MLIVSNFPPVVDRSSFRCYKKHSTSSDLSIVTEVKPVLVTTRQRRQVCTSHMILTPIKEATQKRKALAN